MSKFVMMCLVMTPEITAAVEESDDFKKRKRRNDDARKHAH